MNFGLNANVLTPPYSALVSMLMIAGIDWLGLRMAYLFNLNGPSAPAWHRWQAPILGAMLFVRSTVSFGSGRHDATVVFPGYSGFPHGMHLLHILFKYILIFLVIPTWLLALVECSGLIFLRTLTTHTFHAR
jgi:hypothetical protein